MEHYSTDERDELFTDTGGVKANKEDKVLDYALSLIHISEPTRRS